MKVYVAESAFFCYVHKTDKVASVSVCLCMEHVSVYIFWRIYFSGNASFGMKVKGIILLGFMSVRSEKKVNPCKQRDWWPSCVSCLSVCCPPVRHFHEMTKESRQKRVLRQRVGRRWVRSTWQWKNNTKIHNGTTLVRKAFTPWVFVLELKCCAVFQVEAWRNAANGKFLRVLCFSAIPFIFS